MARRRSNEEETKTTTGQSSGEATKAAPMSPTQIPAEGLTGPFNGTYKGVNKMGRPYTIHNIGEMAVFGAKALDEDLAGLEKGEQVVIKYKGKETKTNKKGDKYSQHSFDVVVGE